MEYTHYPTISCFYSDEEKPSLLIPEAHFEYQMLLVTEGSAIFYVNHRHYTIERKSLVFIGRLERRSFAIQKTPYQRYVASMSGDFIMSNIKDAELTSIFLQRPEEFCHVINLNDEVYSMLLPSFVSMADEFTNQPIFYMAKSAALAISILIHLYRVYPQFFPIRSSSNISTAVLNAQRYVNDYFSQSITLQEIADQNFISRHTLSIAFKNIVGTTFKDYLIRFRMTEAKKLLITTDCSMADIAEMVGYQNVNNFVQIFKSKESLTPLQYRKKYSLPKQD